MSVRPNPRPVDDGYVGRENLEVMEIAVNYNRWLVALAADCMSGVSPVLDFGAGAGTLTRLLRTSGIDIVAVEPDANMARALEHDGIPTRRGLESIADGTLSGIVSFNVLEHIEQDGEALRTLHSKLRPGGKLFLYVPAFPVLFSSMDRQVGHFRRYRRRPLVALLERSGFRVERCRYADSLGFMASLAYRALGSRSGVVNQRAVQLYDRFAFPVSRLVDVLTAGSVGKNLLAISSKPA